jgi:hypothetical protein
MNQSYAEAGVSRKSSAKSMALRILMILAIVAGAFLMLTGGLLVLRSCCYLAMFYLCRSEVEYEYNSVVAR